MTQDLIVMIQTDYNLSKDYDINYNHNHCDTRL